MTKAEQVFKAVIDFYETYNQIPTVAELVVILKSRRDLVMRCLNELTKQGKLFYKKSVIVSCNAAEKVEESGTNWMSMPIRVTV